MHDAVIIAFLGAELEATEAGFPLPAPPRLPAVLANFPRPLRTPPGGIPGCHPTVAPCARLEDA